MILSYQKYFLKDPRTYLTDHGGGLYIDIANTTFMTARELLWVMKQTVRYNTSRRNVLVQRSGWNRNSTSSRVSQWSLIQNKHNVVITIGWGKHFLCQCPKFGLWSTNWHTKNIRQYFPEYGSGKVKVTLFLCLSIASHRTYVKSIMLAKQQVQEYILDRT